MKETKILKHKLFLLSLGSMLLLSSNANAGEVQDFYLDEMVVTASRVETNLLAANANVSIVTRDEIENKHFKNVGEAIKNLPGVNVQNMGSAGGAYVDNPLYLNGSKNIVVLIDGVRVNYNGSDSEKFAQADFVDMEAIERIEVLKGSASTLYGSDAQGGVINIVTRKGNNKVINKISAMTGSYSSEKYGFSSIGSKNGYNWLVSAQKDRSGAFEDGQGRRVPESIDAEVLSLKLGRDFDDNNKLTLYYDQYKSDYTKIKPKKGTDYSTRAIYEGEKDTNRFVAVYNHNFSDKTSNVLSFARQSKKIMDNTSYYAQTGLVISEQITHQAGKHHTLVGGFEYTKDDIDSVSSVKNKNFHNNAFYIQDIWRFSDQFDLTYGIRGDDHSVYGSQDSKSIVFGWKPQNSTNYYVSYKEFFIAPTLSQLYAANSGNPGLEPETGYTIEMGVKHYFDKDFLLDFNMYKRYSEDYIGLVKKNDGSGNSMYTNYDDEHVKGFSLNLSKKFDNGYHAKAGYTYIYVDPQGADKNPNKNGYLPRGVWNFNLGYDKDKLSIDLDGRGVINRDGRKGDKGPKQSTTFWIWDLTANYKISKNIRAFVQVANIFDTNYSERVYALDPEEWYASPGRSYFAGIEYLF